MSLIVSSASSDSVASLLTSLVRVTTPILMSSITSSKTLARSLIVLNSYYKVSKLIKGWPWVCPTDSVRAARSILVKKLSLLKSITSKIYDINKKRRGGSLVTYFLRNSIHV